MTPEEIELKIKSAARVGVPVFLTKEELVWLANMLTDYGIEMQKGIMKKSREDKMEFLLCVTIGLKCAQAAGEL
jgi:hypothetical protein